jgi:CheY-like chemotaxis protein
MAQKKVLVVDDEQDAVEFVRAVLEDEGLQVIAAYDGEAGLQAVAAHQPDLVILDVQMPKKDGFTVFIEMKQSDAMRSIPVVVLTAVADKTGIRFSKEDVGDFVGVEPDAYVEKPVDPQSLLQAVRNLLAD